MPLFVAAGWLRHHCSEPRPIPSSGPGLSRRPREVGQPSGVLLHCEESRGVWAGSIGHGGGARALGGDL
eukprot:6777182-Alexandrium_andersonii.AAC.1